MGSKMAKNWPKMDPKSSKNTPRSGLQNKKEQKTQKREIAPPLNENPCFLGPTWSQSCPNGSKNGQKWTPHPPKMLPEAACKTKGSKKHRNAKSHHLSMKILVF